LPLRVAIVGYGHGGEVFHAPLVAATDGLEVAAIVTSDRGRRERAACAFPDARLYAAVEDLWTDAAQYHLVVITTPNRTHVPLGIAAMEAGLPVVIDKPLAATVADAERLVATGQRTGQMLTVFQNARWSNAFLTIRHLLSAGLVGAVMRFEARSERFRPVPRAGAWRERGEPEEAGGLLYDLGSHLIDQALVLFGQPLHVYAEMERRRPGTQVDDDTFVALRFPSGIIAHLWMSYVARLPGVAVRLVGLDGTYEKRVVDPQEDALRAGHHPGEPGWGREPRERWGTLSSEIKGVHSEVSVETEPGAYQEFYAGVRDTLVIGAAPPVHPEDAIATLRVIEAAQRSDAHGEVVRF
jgi:predicted dehydrogenase